MINNPTIDGSNRVRVFGGTLPRRLSVRVEVERGSLPGLAEPEFELTFDGTAERPRFLGQSLLEDDSTLAVALLEDNEGREAGALVDATIGGFSTRGRLALHSVEPFFGSFPCDVPASRGVTSLRLSITEPSFR